MSSTFLFAIVFPEDGIEDSDLDPDQVATELVEIINEERRYNWPEKGRANDVMVSAIPSPQWVTHESLQRLRKLEERIEELEAAIRDARPGTPERSELWTVLDAD